MFPKPPKSCLVALDAHFEAADKVRDWAFKTFIKAGGPLCNPDHEHLLEAKILFLWASYSETRNGEAVAGTAECYRPQEKKWNTGRSAELLRVFNGGEDPDFIVTLWASYVHEASPEAICALVEHELYHCGQAKDKDGEPRFLGGQPVWKMRGHDVEEFIGVVERYGATNSSLKAMEAAFSRPPLMKRKDWETAVCGCGAVV